MAFIALTLTVDNCPPIIFKPITELQCTVRIENVWHNIAFLIATCYEIGDKEYCSGKNHGKRIDIKANHLF